MIPNRLGSSSKDMIIMESKFSSICGALMFKICRTMPIYKKRSYLLDRDRPAKEKPTANRSF